MVCLRILVRSGKIQKEDMDLLIRGTPDPNPPPMPESAKTWLTEMQWAQLKALENMEAFKKGAKLTDTIDSDNMGWRKWYLEEKAELADLPRSLRDIGPFERLFLLRVLRQDR